MRVGCIVPLSIILAFISGSAFSLPSDENHTICHSSNTSDEHKIDEAKILLRHLRVKLDPVKAEIGQICDEIFYYGDKIYKYESQLSREQELWDEEVRQFEIMLGEKRVHIEQLREDKEEVISKFSDQEPTEEYCNLILELDASIKAYNSCLSLMKRAANTVKQKAYQAFP